MFDSAGWCRIVNYTGKGNWESKKNFLEGWKCEICISRGNDLFKGSVIEETCIPV